MAGNSFLKYFNHFSTTSLGTKSVGQELIKLGVNRIGDIETYFVQDQDKLFTTARAKNSLLHLKKRDEIIARLSIAAHLYTSGTQWISTVQHFKDNIRQFHNL